MPGLSLTCALHLEGHIPCVVLRVGRFLITPDANAQKQYGNDDRDHPIQAKPDPLVAMRAHRRTILNGL